MPSNNYTKDLYVNHGFDFIRSANIKEYDIRAAGFNILIAANVLSKEKIDKLNSLPKKKRNIKIGLMIKSNKEYGKIINKGLVEYRKKFFEANDIEDNNLVSVHRDAILVVNKRIKQTVFDNIEFVQKNKYSSFYYINKKEFYYSKINNTLHVKGIDDEILEISQDYFLSFMRKVISYNEISQQSAGEYLYKFADKYRHKKLNKNYYRELDNGLYRLLDLKFAGSDVGVVDIDKEYIDIDWNYKRYILPLISIVF